MTVWKLFDSVYIHLCINLCHCTRVYPSHYGGVSTCLCCLCPSAGNIPGVHIPVWWWWDTGVYSTYIHECTYVFIIMCDPRFIHREQSKSAFQASSLACLNCGQYRQTYCTLIVWHIFEAIGGNMVLCIFWTLILMSFPLHVHLLIWTSTVVIWDMVPVKTAPYSWYRKHNQA